VNGPFLVLRSTFYFAMVGYRILARSFGGHGKAVFWAGFALSAVVSIILQVTH